MSKTKAAGTSRLGRDSSAQRLGVKIFGGEKVRAGMIIIRQRGAKYLPGSNVKVGSDDTIYAAKDGAVFFSSKTKKSFNGTKKTSAVVNVK